MYDTTIPILAHGGASSRDDPERRSGEWRPAAAARNRGLGRSGTPPARHDDLAARSSLYGSGGNAGDGSAAPGRKSPRWSKFNTSVDTCGLPWISGTDWRSATSSIVVHGDPW